MYDLGKIGELRVAAKIQQYRFAVAFPFGESLPYDLVAIRDGRCKLIQVKTTAEQEKGRSGYAISSAKNDSQNAYTEKDCDYIIVLLHDINVYYVLPTRVVLGKRKIRLYPKSGRGSFETYRERWELLNE